MRRILGILIGLLLLAVFAPVVWYTVFPEAPLAMTRGDRMIPVGAGVSVSAVVRGSGRPVVLVHGLPGSGHDWQPLTALLARRGHRVIAYDRVGYGNSDARKNGEYTPDGSAADLLGLLESEGLEDVTVVGWSYGGGTAIRAARTDASRIGRLVLVGSAGPWPDAPDDPWFAAIIFSRPMMAWFRAVPPIGRGVQSAFSEQAFHPDAMPDWWLPQLEANLASLHTQATYDEEGRLFAWGEDLDPGPIDLPILVIHGDADQLVPLEVGEILHERSTRSQLTVVEGGSHMLPITHTDALAKQIAAFTLLR